MASKKSKKKTPAIDVPGIAAACDALSCDVRAAVVAHLSRTGTATVGELQQSANTSVSGTSQHLAKLKAAGAVTVRRDAQRMIYSLTPGWVERLIGKLREMVGGGEDVHEFVAGGAMESPPNHKNSKKRDPILRQKKLSSSEIAQRAEDMISEPADDLQESRPALSVTASDGDIKPKPRKKSAKKQADKRPDATESPETVAGDSETAQTEETRPDAEYVPVVSYGMDTPDMGESVPDSENRCGGENTGPVDDAIFPDDDPEIGTGFNYAPGRGW